MKTLILKPTMATLAERLPVNVSGRYYVDASCIDCDQCLSRDRGAPLL